MYLTIGTLQKKNKNLTLTVREFNKRIVLLGTNYFGRQSQLTDIKL
jgi:hypothetical protein